MEQSALQAVFMKQGPKQKKNEGTNSGARAKQRYYVFARENRLEQSISFDFCDQNLKWINLSQNINQLEMSSYVCFLKEGMNPFNAFSSLYSMYRQLGINPFKPDAIEDQAFGMPFINALTQDSSNCFPTFECSETEVEEKAESVETKDTKEINCFDKEIMSAKKNSQSNIINQFYSFFSHKEKSEKMVQRVITHLKMQAHAQEIVFLFYAAIRLINAKRGRKYVNLGCLQRMFLPSELIKYIPEIKDKLGDVVDASLLCGVFRRCARLFLKEAGIGAILTSKRISVVSKYEHIKRLRKIQSKIEKNQ